MTVLYEGDIGGSSPDIYGNAVFQRKEILSGYGTVSGLSVPVDDFDGETQLFFYPRYKGRTVRGISQCRGCHTNGFMCLILLNGMGKGLEG